MANWITLQTYNNRQDAELAMGHLRSQGVKARIQSDDCGRHRPSLAMVHGVHLLVKEKQREKAEKALGMKEGGGTLPSDKDVLLELVRQVGPSLLICGTIGLFIVLFIRWWVSL